MAWLKKAEVKVFTQEQEFVKELINSKGWKMMEDKLRERRGAALHALLTQRDLNEIIRAQAQVGELDFLLKYPVQLLNEK